MINNLIKLGGYLLLAREAADFLANSREVREMEWRRKITTCAVSSSLVGITIGVAAGLLFAPRSGKETREIISTTTSEKVKNLQNELRERKRQFEDLLNKGKEELLDEAEEIIEEKVAG
jgi:hypothetical protein